MVNQTLQEQVEFLSQKLADAALALAKEKEELEETKLVATNNYVQWKKAEQQRDELLAAVKEAEVYVRRYNSDRAIKVEDMCTAAIDSVEGKE